MMLNRIVKMLSQDYISILNCTVFLGFDNYKISRICLVRQPMQAEQRTLWFANVGNAK